MKKIAFFGFLTSLLVMSGSAFAATVTVASQQYVDDGLRAVYRAVDTVKANAADVYTKDEIDNAGYLTSADIDAKANAADVYTKEEIDNAGYLTTAAIDGKADADDVYTKEEIDNAGYITAEDVESGKKYVYTSAGWDEIVVEDTFNPDMGG